MVYKSYLSIKKILNYKLLTLSYCKLPKINIKINHKVLTLTRKKTKLFYIYFFFVFKNYDIKRLTLSDGTFFLKNVYIVCTGKPLSEDS